MFGAAKGASVRAQMIFLGRNIGEQHDYSERAGQMIAEEIHRFLEEALARATSIVTEHRGLLTVSHASSWVGKRWMHRPWKRFLRQHDFDFQVGGRERASFCRGFETSWSHRTETKAGCAVLARSATVL